MNNTFDPHPQSTNCRDASAQLNLIWPFFEFSQVRPDAGALWVDGRDYSYADLADSASRVAGWLRRAAIPHGGRVGVLTRRTYAAYAGILGTCWHGGCYVPLNANHPSARISKVLESADLHALIVDVEGLRRLESDQLSNEAPAQILKLVPEEGCANTGAFPALALVDPVPEPASMQADDLGYIIFTSGTTGLPKGVMVTAANLQHFVAIMQKEYGFTHLDRMSQFYELTFDVSILDLFVGFNTGATLYVVPDKSRMAPAKFIREHELTVWASVPSNLAFMSRVRQLSPNSFPSLRLSIFIGEPLLANLARQWVAATTNGQLENLYGPTEATVACTGQPCTDEIKITPGRDSVAIGKPFPGLEAAILDENRNFLSAGKVGELAIQGPQVAAGYWRSPELTERQYPTLDHPLLGPTRWYLTGDLAYLDVDGDYHCLGRIDNQIKLFGHRIELEDIDSHLRVVSGTEEAATIVWPVSDGIPEGLVGFVTNQASGDTTKIAQKLKKLLPTYMVPSRIISLDQIPLTPNGKTDRKALYALLEEAE